MFSSVLTGLMSGAPVDRERPGTYVNKGNRASESKEKSFPDG